MRNLKNTTIWRANLVLIFIIFFGAIIICRLVFFQILHGNYYKALARGQQEIFENIQGERGEIFLKDGKNLAANVKEKFLYISPREIKKKNEVAQSLSKILGLKEDIILEKILSREKKKSLFELIKTRLTEDELEKLSELKIKGVYLGEKFFRNYPYGNFASQVIGFFSSQEKGQYGIENFYDKVLQGKEGLKNKKNTPWQYLKPFPENQLIKGADLILTLDYNIQFMAEKLLSETEEKFGFESGQILVIEPNTGKILAMANFPSFDLNKYREVKNLEIFQNKIIQKTFEPGSVLKPFTMAIALENGKITPETVYTDNGFVKIKGRTIFNYGNKAWGERTMTEVLENSINTGAVFVQSQVLPEIFLTYLQKFGFFEPVGIDLQGEVFSENKILRNGKEINLATASFGQGIEITPLQLVRAFSALINEGKLSKPYLVEKIIENNGENAIGENAIDENAIGENAINPQLSEPIISQKTSSQIINMLVNVVENGGAKRAKISGYYIGGKTGTAQVPWSYFGIDKQGYSDKTIQSFIGFGPAFNPKFLILVKLDSPKTKDASSSAVFIFKELAKYIIDSWQIPPDYE